MTELRLWPVSRCSTIRPALRLLLVLLVLPMAQEIQALDLGVRVEGLTGEYEKYEKNVLALLGIYQERKDKDLSVPRLEALHRRAPDQIRKALAPFGFYRVQVEDTLTRPTAEDGAWVADYQVVPGEPVRVGQAQESVDYRITGPGAEDPIFPKAFPIQPGDVLLHSEYDKATDNIRSLAARNGYLDYELTFNRALIDLDNYQAIIQFHLHTGPRYYLGDVSFTQDLLDDRYLARFVGFQPKDRYDPEALLTLQGNLLGTEYYERVEIVPHKEAAGEKRTVPIEVIATPNKANKYRFGFGYATDVGPRVTLEWRRRYLTRWGHTLKLETNISQPLQRMKGDYRIPIGNPLRDYVTIRPDLRSYDIASRKGDIQTLQVAHSVVTPGGWRRTTGIDYRREQFEIAADDAELVNELVPNITWSKTVTDDPVYTTNGYRIKFALLGTAQGLISPASYLSGSARFKWIKSFLDHYRLIARSDLGASWANSVFDLPASRRYFAGGDNSIRGWALDVLGPDDPGTKEAVGGRYLAVGSLELERRIKGDWSGAVFTDFGNAFDPDFTRQVEVGTGLGIRWRSPIGQIRMDVAFALTKDSSPARLHIVIGPDL
ncbi:autotransporter assembly complex protein TamA [Candidatus Thiosymbion oneisti]|uniref:autotransporter assembly complex protein TamA n=1 Tax=Candidatus Thiosymbion oneisti TaxID=589554 RepID=UPI000ACEE5CC|nr:autotransporter assembly complex family protein [Candidatus Thiosymbion oneisti]